MPGPPSPSDPSVGPSSDPLGLLAGGTPQGTATRSQRLLLRMRRRMSLPSWLASWLAIGGAAMVLFFAVYLIDYYRAPSRPSLSPLRLLFRFDIETAQNALGNLAQVVVAVLGIVITVVSIVVQLAATRYTPRIAPMFFRDRKNLAMLGFFVVTCILSLWVSLSVSADLVPRVAIALTLGLVTLSLLLILPYFGYVFNFLDPEKIIHRIQEQTLILSIQSQGSTGSRQRAVLDGIEQLSDIAVNAITSRDQLIAASAVDALKDLGVGYLPLKIAQEPPWFQLARDVRTSPDFVSMAPESLAALNSDGTWVEWKILRQLMNVYTVAIAELPDIGHLIAIDARYLGEAALETNDRASLRLCIKFFNTFIRIALNTQKVRSAYNVLHQYRQLGEKLIAFEQPELLCEVAEHMRYYAQTALNLHLGFVTETLAYDLAALCEEAAKRHSPAHDTMLGCLLSIDQAAETEAQELTLRGVRKAQIKLATAYIEMHNELAAHRIYLDMQHERPERLLSIRDELLAVHTKDFWEIVDRGTNFDYLEPSRKERLKIFFGWFDNLDDLPMSPSP